MPALLGIDLGTQSVKALVLDDQGRVLAVAQAEYPILTPRVGRAEQDPAAWWRATCATIRQAIADAGVAPSDVVGVGFSGQMHGTVCVDAQGAPVCPAIIWCDGRSGADAEQLTATIGRERLGQLVANPIAAGFMAATVHWLARHEPGILRRTATLLLPKDYVRLRLTGNAATDHTDAASTLLYDVARRAWSHEMLRAVGIDAGLLPCLAASHEVCGTLTAEAAAATGLAEGTPVVAGGGDQPVGAIGHGVVDPGTLLVTIGTGGQLFTPLATPAYDPELRTHTFPHAVPDRWFAMGAMLSAGLCLRWLRDQVYGGLGLDYASLAAAAAEAPPGSEGLLFLPYLLGERTPHMDAQARGVFFGLALRHERRHLVRAVMEGVAYALRDCLDVLRSLGAAPDRIVATGGGMRSPTWQQILADVLAAPVATVDVDEPPARGAAILAGIGTGVFADFAAATRLAPSPGDPVEPIAANVERYAPLHGLYRSLYPRLKDAYRELPQ
ncbi:xylulokinase [bacterium]|nr:xylulokinase [bacterium]